MGATSSQLPDEEVETLQQSTGFSTAQIHRLYRRFRRLDRSDTGFITSEEFMSIPELAKNPLVERLVELFDRDGSGDASEGAVQITFEKFLNTLAVFLPITERSKHMNIDDDDYKAWVDRKKKEKLQFVFHIYDIKQDGFIDANELFAVLKMMVTDGITDEQLTFIVDQTIKEADGDRDGKISFDEFCRILENTDIDQRMTIRF
eukprot:m.82139 g.82139  ORF g.82139 m.82139 type:complete len:204 (+) comp14283_c0_seq2:95-706(+)